MTILDGRAFAEQGLGVGAHDLRGLLLLFVGDAEIPPMNDANLEAVPLVAEINHGTWIAPCPCGAVGLPSPGCVVWISQPWAWCVRCENAAADRHWRPVVLPEPAERVAIEGVLERRPERAARNWVPGEMVTDLIAQNVEHGIVEAT